MKALVMKDFYLLRKLLLWYVFAIVAFQAMPGITGSFIAVLYAALLPSNAFAYDDRSHWDEMEVMLPCSTRAIVLSRYCIGWITILSFAAISVLAKTAFALLFRYFRVMPGLWETPTPREYVGAVAVAFVIQSLGMPIFFRFDAEKSRVVRTLTVLAICGVAGGLLGVVSVRNFAFSNRILSGGFAQSLWPELLVSLAVTVLSVPLSMRMWRRRHR